MANNGIRGFCYNRLTDDRGDSDFICRVDRFDLSWSALRRLQVLLMNLADKVQKAVSIKQLTTFEIKQ